VRRCLGAAFAEMEMRVVIRCVLRTRTLKAASANAERPTRRNVTLSPRHGTRVIISPRSGIARPPSRSKISDRITMQLRYRIMCSQRPAFAVVARTHASGSA
jgi:hypothetical protein